jgi:hypothetical protein
MIITLSGEDLKAARKLRGKAYAEAIKSKARKTATGAYEITLGEINEALRYATAPPLAKQLKNLISELITWKRAGFKIASWDQIKSRADACRACKYRINGIIPRCGKCGCTDVKLVLASAKCPVKRWPV